MKKKLMLLLLLFCMLFPTAMACSPGDGGGDSGGNNSGGGSGDNSGGSSGATISSINISYMKDLIIDIGDATAFGIKREEVDVETVAKISLIDGAVSMEEEEEIEQKFYLYATTESYENGNVEYEGNSITKVTFKKNTLVEENVYDSNGNLIDSNKVVKQEEIPAQINRLNVNEKFMFMQFVAEVGESGNYNYVVDNETKSEYVELRPDALTYDENGISGFDLKNYYSSALSQSFVVDMTNGNIYKITDFNIAKIHDVDIVKDNEGNYYKMSINNKRELVFTDIIPNKEVEIDNVLTDKYGYTFVANSHIDSTDSENKIIYFTNTKYMISDVKEVYTVDYDSGTLMDHIEKIVINGVEQTFDSSKIVRGLTFIRTNIAGIPMIGYYKGKRVYNGNIGSSMGKEFVEDSLYFSNPTYQSIEWLENDFSTSVLMLKVDGKMYYKVVDIESSIGNNIVLGLSDFTKISDSKINAYDKDYYINVGQNKIKIKNVYVEQALSGTKYYKLSRVGDEIMLNLLKDKDYSQNVYIFQPINK